MSNILKGILNEAADKSWEQAYKVLQANAGEPDTSKGALTFQKQLAMLAKSSKIYDRYELTQFLRDYNAYQYYDAVRNLIPQSPTLDQMEQFNQQSQIQQTNFQQQQEIGHLQHNLNVQQLVQRHELEAQDQKDLLTFDVQARLAIQKIKQEQELDAKERLVAIQREIEDRNERKEIRDHELKLAQAGYDHDINVINATAEGEYKKAKLEADYQIQIKQLENIDNAGERQNKLDQINTMKEKELAIINAETNAKIRAMEAGTQASRAESDLRIRESFMDEFKPIWGSLIQRASEVGKTLGQSIGAVTSALSRLGSVVMPKAVEEGEEMGTFAALKDWRVWDVHVFNNFYRGKYADYGPRLYSVVASSPEEARQLVIDNPDYVLQDLLSRKLQSGKRVLPRQSALPIEAKRVGKVDPGSITTMGLKKMLTPDGVQSFKFSNGKIVDGAHTPGGVEVAEANKFFKPGPATTGKFPEPRKPKFQGDQGSKSETLGRDGLIYHWQDPRAKQGVAEGLDHSKRQQLIKFLAKKMGWEHNYLELASDANLISWYKKVQAGKDPMKSVEEEKQRLDPKCWTGYKKQGTKMKGGVRVNNCVPIEEGGFDSDAYYNARSAGEYGRGMSKDVEPSAHYDGRGDGKGERGRPVQDKLKKSNLPADPFGRTTGKIPASAKPKRELDPFRDVDENKEADYGDDYQAMVQRVGQKAKEQEKKKPVDIQALARRLNQPEKKSNILKGIEENLGTPYPSTYEEENKPFKKKGAYRITAMTSESKKK